MFIDNILVTFTLRHFHILLYCISLSLSLIYMHVTFYHINLFNFMQGCSLTTRIKVTFDLI